MDAEILDLLTPGAVCRKRENPRKGAPVHVIMLTNVSLSEKLQEKYPVQVVYSNEMRQVFSRTVESFFDLYDFHNVDVDVETRIGDIFTPLDSDEDGEPGIVIDRSRLPVATSAVVGIATEATGSPQAHSHVSASSIVLNDEDDDEDDEDDEDVGEKAAIPVEARIETDDADYDDDEDETPEEDQGDNIVHEDVAGHDGQTQIQFSMTTLEDAPLPALGWRDLTPALAGYSQDPDVVNNRIVHKLAFLLGKSVTVDSLIEAFRPSTERNTVDVFALVGPHFNDVIQWTDFVGVYPEIAGTEAYANVILVEQLSYPVEDEGPLTTLTAAENPVVSAVIENLVAQQVEAQEDAIEILAQQAEAQAEAQEVAAEIRAQQVDAPAESAEVVDSLIAEFPAVAEAPAEPEVPAAPKVPSVQNMTQHLVRNVVPNQPVVRGTLHLPTRTGQ